MAVQSVKRTAQCDMQWLPVGAVGSVRQGLQESGGGMSRETRRGQGEREYMMGDVVSLCLLLQVRVVSQVWLRERARMVASFK
jgi:hypothetical protein